MSFFSSPKKLLLLGFILVILIAIPISVFVLQKQQTTKTKAAPSTKLSFSPQTVTATAGGTLTFDITVNPGNNQISFVKLVINYDPSKLAYKALTENKSVFPSVLEGPTKDEDSSPAVAAISLSVGADPAKVITSAAKIASITFKALSPTDPLSPTQVSFGTGVQALSIGSSDTANENIIQQSSLSPASVTIAQAQAPTPTSGPSGTNQVPVCTSLNIDRTPAGTAPFAITFTANGTDANGTIKKVTFDFGDGPVQDVTQGATIGTNLVSVQLAHSYQNTGTFKATAILTDDKGGISDPSKCTQTITVSANPAGGTPSPTAPVSPSPTSTEEAELTPTPITEIPSITVSPTSIAVIPTIPPPGPENLALKLGGAAAVLSVLGALIFLFL